MLRSGIINRYRSRCRSSASLLLALALFTLSPEAYSAIGSVGFDTTDYLYAPTPGQVSVFPSLAAKAEVGNETPVFDNLLSVEARVMMVNTNPLFVEAPQAYVGTSKEFSPVRLSIGRRLESWSRLDDQWQLGLWQPRYRWDYLNPESVGLTGLFLDAHSGLLRITAFGSPLFVPERGVPVNFQNGQVSSPMPWFLSPSQSIYYQGRETALLYHLQMPNVDDVLLHPGAAFRARIGGDQGAWVAAGYAYLPINQLLMGYSGVMYLGSDPPVVDATTYVRVAYHHLTTLEGGYEGDRVSFWASGVYEQPVRDVTPADWTTQEISPALTVASGVEWTPRGRNRRDTRFGVSYLRGWGGNAPDAGGFASQTGSAFEPRYPFQNALSLSGTYPLFAGVRLDSRWLYDIGHDGIIWSTDFTYALHDKWSVGLGTDLLGTGIAESSPSFGRDFISLYRSNDRVHLGVSYVF